MLDQLRILGAGGLYLSQLLQRLTNAFARPFGVQHIYAL
jgi:hypothetical protein